MVPRRRVNPSSTLARRRAGQSRIRSKMASEITDDIRNRLNLGARQAAAEIMNRLAEKGPVYGGAFRDSWRAIPIGSGASGRSGGQYPYTTRDVPSLSKALKEVKRAAVFEITNITEYAAIALDLEPPDEQPYFINPGYEPEGGMEFGVVEGRRFGAIRGQVRPFAEGEKQRRQADELSGKSVRPPSISTAPLNWYTNYMRSGAVDKEIERAFRFAFAPRQRPVTDYAQYISRRSSL